jgi:calcium-dependent protein kinase
VCGRRRAGRRGQQPKARASPDTDLTVFKAVKKRVTSSRTYSQGDPDLGLLRLKYDPTRPFQKEYEKQDKIGAGAFGAVFKVRHKISNQTRAMKILDKKKEVKEDMAFVITEIEAMVRLDHPNIVKFFQFFEDNEYIYLVSELCPDGDFSHLQRNKTTPSEVPSLFQDVFRGVAYCHDQGITHRDLKFENCLMVRGRSRRVGKVIDFGLSSIKPDNAADHYMNEALGTKYFVAPEVIEKKMYGAKCDIWSLGIMLYIIWTKEHPFAENATKIQQKDLFKQIRSGRLRMGPLDRAHAEPALVSLVKESLLVKDPAARASAELALDQEWLRSTPDSPDSGKMTKEQATRLLSFHDMSRFEKTVLMMVAHHAEQKTVEDLHSAFVSLDTHANGSLDAEELKAGLRGCGKNFSEQQMNKSFESVDVNHNGKIDYSEWLTATIAPTSLSVDAAIKELFSFFDSDGSGSVSVSELREVVGEAEGAHIMEDADKDGNHELDLEEFKCLLHKVKDHRLQMMSKT